MEDLRTARMALVSAAREFDASSWSGDEAIGIVQELGVQRRLIDGMLGKAAKRVEDTAAYTYHGDRNAAELCQRMVGVGTGEAKRAIETAGKLEALPATDAAVRAGTLGARATELIVSVAAGDPSVERQLLRVAAKGIVPLRDECIAVRAAREDQTERAERLHAKRSFRTWSTPEGMVEGHFSVTPEVGGAINAVIEDGTRRRFREARSDGALHGTRIPRARPQRGRPRQRGPHRPVEPHLALLHPPHPKNPGLDSRPTRSHHRQTKTRPTSIGWEGSRGMSRATGAQ